MAKLKNFTLNILQSPIFHYIGINYLTYGLQFINSILIAKFLGVYFFGIYSFLLLINQYLIYAGMAPSYSLNAILATRKNELVFSEKLFNNTLLLSAMLIGLVSSIVLIIAIYIPTIFLKYQFSEYFLLIILIFALTSLNNVYVNLYRTYGLLQKINFNQFIIPLIQFLVILLAKGKVLLYYLLVGTIISNTLSLLLFIHKPPLKNSFNFEKTIFTELLTRGFHLLLYNVSFYLILLSSRTIVSIYYTAEELGYYTLAVNLSNAVFMIVGAFSYVLYPKILNRFYNVNTEEAKFLLSDIRALYITSCYLITYLGFFAIPILELLLPQYNKAMPAFKILLLTQLILNNNFGYSILLIARRKEMLMTKYAFVSMLIIIIISLAITIIKLPFTIIAMAVSFGFLYYCVRITKKALEEITQNNNIKNIFFELFPPYYFVPILILIISIIIKDDYFTPISSLIIFIIMNSDRIINVWRKGYSFISAKESLKF